MQDPITQHDHYDAIVVGARCAGAASAMLMARRGMRVLAVDRSAYGSDTLSSHILLRTGVLQLARWGLLDRLRATDTTPVTRTVFHYGPDAAEVPMKPRDGVDALYAPRRTVLDPILVDAAREAGVEVRHRVQLAGLERDAGGRVAGVRLRTEDGSEASVSAPLVIGADGRHSPVGRLAGTHAYRTGDHATATIFGYFEDLRFEDGPANHWFYRPDVSVGFAPTGGGLVMVFAAGPAHRMREALRIDAQAALRRGVVSGAPELADAFARSRQVGRLCGFGGQPGWLRQSHGPGWALVGDAGYFKDPITAHGISDALRDAELLAEAASAGTDAALARYQTQRDALSNGMFELTDEIAGFGWDYARVAELHMQMVGEIRDECRALLALDAPAATTTQVSRAVGAASEAAA